MKVAIVGGGIGGLGAACALQRQGINAQVYEQAREIGEVGAAVALAPNSLRLMNRLGLQSRIAALGSPLTRGSRYLRHDGTPAAALSDDPDASDVVHGIRRSDLVAMFLDLLPATAIHTGHRCTGFEQDEDTARVTFANGTAVEADVVIAADGIHSVLQGYVGTQPPPVFSESVAYRGYVPAEGLADWPLDRSMMWLGEGKHFLVYPVRGGKQLNYVAFVPASDEMKESWSAPGDAAQLRREFQDWDPRVRSLLDLVETTFQWGLYDREPLPEWTRGRMTLLGDAAHPMLPHLGQGANQSIEDGFALALTLRHADPSSVNAALRHYQQVRIHRTAEIQRASRRTGKRFDSDYEDLAVRDAELAASAAFRAWMRNHDVEAEYLGLPEHMDGPIDVN